MKFDIRALALAMWLTWAVGVLFLWLLWMYNGFWLEAISVLWSIYNGFDITSWGVTIGTVWAFVDWFIGWLIFAVLYNSMSCSTMTCYTMDWDMMMMDHDSKMDKPVAAMKAAPKTSTKSTKLSATKKNTSTKTKVPAKKTSTTKVKAPAKKAPATKAKAPAKKKK